MILIYMLPGLFAPIGVISPTLLRPFRARLHGQQRSRSTHGRRSLLYRFLDLLDNIPLMSSAPPKQPPKQPPNNPKPDTPPRPPPSGPKPFPGDETKKLT